MTDNLYLSLREQAETAWHNGDFRQSRLLYVKCAKQAALRKQDHSHSIALAYAGAAGAAMNCKSYALALRHLAQSFAAMKPQKDFFLETFNYTAAMLVLMRSYKQYLPTRTLSLSCAELCRTITRRFKRTLLAQSAPKATQSPVKLKRHGDIVLDRYVRLEDLTNPQSKKWLEEIAAYSQSILNLALLDYQLKEEIYRSLEPHRELPYRVGQWYYFEEIDRESNYPVIKRAPKINGRARAIFSGADVAINGSHIASTEFHPNGKLAAYSLTESGSDLLELRVRNLVTNKDIGNLKIQTRNQPLFHPDGKGLIYWKENPRRVVKEAPNLEQAERPLRIYYRRMSRTGKERLFLKPQTNKVDVLDVNFVLDAHTVLVQEWHSDSGKHVAYLKRLDKPRKKTMDLFGGKLQKHTFIGGNKNTLYFRTTDGAPRGKIFQVTIDTTKWCIISKRTVIAECQKPIRSAILSKHRLVVHYLDERGKHSLLKSFSLDGKEACDITLPFEGFISDLHSSYASEELFFIIHHFDKPSQAWVHSLKKGKSTLLFKRAPEKQGLVKTLVEVESKDGTMVPVWILHKQGLKPSPNTPALIEVYGGFDVPNLPYTSYKIDAWLDLGGLWVQPYVRGGGELGEDWHKAATKAGKQKTFDDAIACAEFLIKQGWTSPARLAISGSSNGGLTVAAVILQRPELFGAAIAANGLFDMLSYEDSTIGWGWVGEYGTISRKSDYQALKKYSPYQSIRANQAYPPLLLCVSEWDDRVPPWHSYKFAAALCRTGSPVFLRLEKNAGHKTYGSSWVIRDELAFLKFFLGIEDKT